MAEKTKTKLFVLFFILFQVVSAGAQENVGENSPSAPQSGEDVVSGMRPDGISTNYVEAEGITGELSDEEMQKRGLVEVEPNYILPSDITHVYKLVPYLVRRHTWGDYISLTYSGYQPINYSSDYSTPAASTFNQIYGTSFPLVELSYTYKYSFHLGSIGPEVGVGAYSATTTDVADLGNAQLNLQIARIGAKYVMDTFFYEPYVAPYIMGGGYTVFFNETQGNSSFQGTTQIAPYFGFGALVQLNWLDPVSAVEAFTESGIENTYFFIEGRQYLASANSLDPDFSAGLHVNAGVTIEF